MSTNRLLGRSTSGTGEAEEITLGTNLSFSGTTLNAAGGGGLPSGMTYTSPVTTTGQSVLDIGGTFNGAGQTLTGLRVNVTDTASAVGSLLAEVLLAGALRVGVRKDGAAAATSFWVNRGFGQHGVAYETGLDGAAIFGGGTAGLIVWNQGAAIPSTLPLGWLSGAVGSSLPDLYVRREGPGVFAQRNGTNSQTSRIYGTWTNGSNGRWLETAMTTAGVASILPTGNGTGASGNVLHISGLPTSNPGPGILWNDVGTVKVGT
jgi:hypothetical protein